MSNTHPIQVDDNNELSIEFHSTKNMEPGDACGSNGEMAMMGVCSPMDPPGVRVVSVHTESSSRCIAACKSSSFSSSRLLFNPSPAS